MVSSIAINCVKKNSTLLDELFRLSIMDSKTNSQPSRKIIAHNIALLRKHRGWSQAELARRAGVSQRTISNMENPDTETTPTTDRVEQVAEVFGLQLYQLAMPLPLDLLIDIGNLTSLVDYYAHSRPEIRPTIEQVAKIAASPQ